jgi:cytochrome c oxidase subunit 3
LSARAAASAYPSGHGERLRAPVLGMVLFLASEVMFFGGLFGAYYMLRANASQWPPEGSPHPELVIPVLLTLLLASSSLTQHHALRAAQEEDRRRTIRWTLVTVTLGAAFLAGEGWEWSQFIGGGFTVSSNVFGTLFFTMTGFHGLHLGAGLVMLLVALAKALGRSEHAARVGVMEATTLYWHFVDVVWLFLVTSLYVLPALD